MERRKAAVFLLMGQSNAVGFATRMEERDRIVTPLKNVFGLRREHNLSLDVRRLTWTGYTSAGTILGEENDHTWSVSNCLAKLWQARIDEGADLPDLYDVNISVGAEGVTPGNMWYPRREPVLVPGPLGTVNISLCPFAARILSLIREGFREAGTDWEIVGLHWRGGEEDLLSDRDLLRTRLKNIYLELFRTFSESLGRVPPVVLHRIVARERCTDLDPSGQRLENLEFINSVFEELAAGDGNFSVFDVRNAPYFRPDVPGNGLFLEDKVHFTPEVNRWVAKTILDRYEASARRTV